MPTNSIKPFNKINTREWLLQTQNYSEWEWEGERTKMKHRIGFATEAKSDIIRYIFKNKTVTAFEVTYNTLAGKKLSTDTLNDLVGILLHIKGTVNPRGVNGGRPAKIYGLFDATEDDVEDARRRYYMATIGYDPVEQEQKRLTEFYPVDDYTKFLKRVPIRSPEYTRWCWEAYNLYGKPDGIIGEQNNIMKCFNACEGVFPPFIPVLDWQGFQLRVPVEDNNAWFTGAYEQYGGGKIGDLKYNRELCIRYYNEKEGVL